MKSPDIHFHLDIFLDILIRNRNFAVLDPDEDALILTALSEADPSEGFHKAESLANGCIAVWRIDDWRARQVKSPAILAAEVKAREHATFIAALRAYRDLRHLIASKLSKAADSELVISIASAFRLPTEGNKLALIALGLSPQQALDLLGYSGKIEIL
jgi:hypothetical protein